MSEIVSTSPGSRVPHSLCDTLNKYKLYNSMGYTNAQKAVQYTIQYTVQNIINYRTSRQTVGAITAQFSALKSILIVQWRVEVVSCGVVAGITWSSASRLPGGRNHPGACWCSPWCLSHVCLIHLEVAGCLNPCSLWIVYWGMVIQFSLESFSDPHRGSWTVFSLLKGLMG